MKQYISNKAVVDAFILLFIKANPLTLQGTDGSFNTTIRYFKLSSLDYTEEQPQQLYPVISITDYPTENSEKWNRSGFIRTGNVRKSSPELSAADVATTYEEPLLRNFRFDLSIATKSYEHHRLLEDWLYKNFFDKYSLVLEITNPELPSVGIPITLKVNTQDIPRVDGVKETNFEVTFDTWVHSQDPVDVEIVQTIVVNIQPKTL